MTLYSLSIPKRAFHTDFINFLKDFIGTSLVSPKDFIGASLKDFTDFLKEFISIP